MYDVTITNVNTLEVNHMRLGNPLNMFNHMDWAEIHAQHEVEEQIDIKVITKSGDRLHIKAREVNDND